MGMGWRIKQTRENHKGEMQDLWLHAIGHDECTWTPRKTDALIFPTKKSAEKTNQVPVVERDGNKVEKAV